MLGIILSGEHAFPERGMRNNANLVFETEGTFVSINGAIRQTVREFIGDNDAVPQRSTQQIIGKVADAEPADFALLFQFIAACIVSSTGVSGSG